MGFTAGMVSSMGMGNPHYYIDDEGNRWDRHTYALVSFDGSGSMNGIISPITNALTGPYFSSGDAASQNGVKSTDSLRAQLQDVYADAGIEGSPDWNTDAATNGKTEFNKHVLWISTGERSVFDMSRGAVSFDYSANNAAVYTDYSHAYYVTPSNIVRIVICNESQSQYHDGQNGNSWANTEITSTYKADVSRFRAVTMIDIASGGVYYQGTSSYHFVNSSHTLRNKADGYKPSFTGVFIDPGSQPVQSHYHDYNNMTASQRFLQDGVLAGQGLYAPDAVNSGDTYSLIGWDDETTLWNGKSNEIKLVKLIAQSANTSVTFWKNQIVEALKTNITFP